MRIGGPGDLPFWAFTTFNFPRGMFTTLLPLSEVVKLILAGSNNFV